MIEVVSPEKKSESVGEASAVSLFAESFESVWPAISNVSA